MTREEAIKRLIDERDNDIFASDFRDKQHEALTLAIESLEAWEKVKKELEEMCLPYFDEKKGCYTGLLTLERVLEIINKHLGEVDDRVTNESIIRTHLEDVVESGFSLDEIANVLEKMRNAK